MTGEVSRVTDYATGCAPGGTGRVTLYTTGGTRLDSVTDEGQTLDGAHRHIHAGADTAETETYTPTCTPSGSIKATSTSVRVGGTTTITGYNLQTCGAGAKFRVNGPLWVGGCVRPSSDEDLAEGESDLDISAVFLGCSPGGTATVKLLTGNSRGSAYENVRLASISITVTRPPGPIVPTPIPYGEGQPDGERYHDRSRRDHDHHGT